MPTPKNPNPHTFQVNVEVNVYDAGGSIQALASVEAALDRIDGIKLDDDTIVTLEVPCVSGP